MNGHVPSDYVTLRGMSIKMGDGGCCHYCRRYECICPPDPPKIQRYIKFVCPGCGKTGYSPVEGIGFMVNCECGAAFELSRKDLA